MAAASWRGLLRQTIYTIMLSQLLTSNGTSLAFVGFFTTEVSRPTSQLALSPGQVTWVGSVFMLATLAGFLTSMVVAAWLGTRRLVLVSVPVLAAGWLLISFGPDVRYVLTGRVLVGVGIGLPHSTIKNSICESSSAHVRGVMLALSNIFIQIGILTGYTLAWVLPWRTASLLMGLVPVVVLTFGVLFFPESARWMLTHGRSEAEARRSIVFFQGTDHDVDAQVAAVVASLGDGHQQTTSVVALLKQLLERRYLRPLLIVICQMFLYVFTGGVTVSSYASVIFGGTSGGPYRDAVIMSALQVVAGLSISSLIERFSRASLLVASGTAGAVGCTLAGIFFHWRETLAGYDWLATVGLLVHAVTFVIGISPVTWILAGELLPNAVRAVTSPIINCFFGGFLFLLTKLFPGLTDSLGQGGTLWMFAVMNVVQVVFALCVLPRTSRMSLEEIQAIFEAKTASVSVVVRSHDNAAVKRDDNSG